MGRLVLSPMGPGPTKMLRARPGYGLGHENSLAALTAVEAVPAASDLPWSTPFQKELLRFGPRLSLKVALHPELLHRGVADLGPRSANRNRVAQVYKVYCPSRQER